MRSAALLAVAGQDVSVGGRDASPPGAAQPHRLQLGRVRPAAGAGALEGLLEHGAEGDEGVGAGGVAAVALAARQQHHLQNRGSRHQALIRREEALALDRGGFVLCQAALRDLPPAKLRDSSENRRVPASAESQGQLR